MTDQQLLERRVRETLATRADGVAATPVLYERVQRGIRRDRRWGLARAWTMLATIVVLAGLVIVALPSDEVGVDIVDAPSDTTRDDGDGSTDADTDGGTDTAPPSDLPFGGVGYAVHDGDGLTVYSPDGGTASTWAAVRVDDDGVRTVRPVVDLAVSAGWSREAGVLAALVGEQSDGNLELALLGGLDGDPPRVSSVGGVAPTGGRVVVTPDGSAVLWIEDSRLVVVDMDEGGPTDDAPHYFDLSSAPVPDGLVAQQVIRNDDGGLVLFATDPVADEAWSLPLSTDATGAVAPVDTSPQAPGEGPQPVTALPGPVPELGVVLDVVSLPDGSMLSLEAPADGGEAPFLRRTTFGQQGEDQVQPLPDLLWPNDGGFELDTGGGWQVTLHDGERGIVHRYVIVPDAAGEEPLALSHGADAAVAGVHVGASPAAWGGVGDAADDWRDELAELQEQELREQLAKAHAAVDHLRAEIASLEHQQEQTTDAVEAQAIEQQLTDLRRALQRQVLMMRASKGELVARRLQESSQSPLVIEP